MRRGPPDLSSLPKFRDGMSWLYVEAGRIEAEARGVALVREDGTYAVPVAEISLLMAGPGTSLTHQAAVRLADHGVTILWTGEAGVRLYACGLGETRSSKNLERQASLWAVPASRMRVVRRMYQLRFAETLDPTLSIAEIRGMEGKRVQSAYREAAVRYGIDWKGRSYERGRWGAADLPNRALSVAASCLYGLCHAAIVSMGFSSALGFVHSGRMMSFVYDVADLYKAEISVPAAFAEVAHGAQDIERRVRIAMRDRLNETKLLGKIEADLFSVLDLDGSPADDDPRGTLVDDKGSVPSAENYGMRGGQPDDPGP